MWVSRARPSRLITAGLLLAVCALTGCAIPPRACNSDEQAMIDRQLVEYPAGYELRRYVTGLTAPECVAFDADGSLLVAQWDRGDDEPKIWRFSPNNPKPTLFYPHEQRIIPARFTRSWQMYGPIGGMVVVDGKVIVTHRDENDMGLVTALDSKGGHTTICAGFPCQGDHGLTDLAYDPRTKKLWFGCGTATNSGVVGMDNIQNGWVRAHPDVHDQSWHDLYLLGFRFQTNNPFAGIFGPAENAITVPFQAFNQTGSLHVRGSPEGKPNGAIYSVAVTGGFATVEGHGFHYPRGIGFDEFGAVYFTNDGMEMIKDCTRPVRDDPDAFIRLPPGNPFGGWPDYSTIFELLSDPKYQPPIWMLTPTGYEQVRATIDLNASHLTPPVREAMLEAAFPSLSGAARFAFVPPNSQFGKDFAGNAIIALSGDRSPYASGGIILPHPVGFKLVRVDTERHVTIDFIRNVGDLPRSKIDDRNRSLIERPVDVKFGPDGALYILDEGHMEVKNGQESFIKNSGQIFRLVPVAKPATTQAK